MKTLAKHVFIPHPEDPSKSRWFAPGDVLPDWAAKVATDPALYGQGETAAEQIIFDEIDYTGMKVDELRLLLTERGLDTGGNKAELVRRLEAHDASVG